MSRRQRPQARSRAATRRRLLSAGARLFARRGFHGATSNDVAREARVATGTFYLHFKDKRELLQAIALEVHERHQQEIRAQLEGGETLAAALEVRARALLELAEKHRDLVRVALGPDGEDAAVAEAVREAVAGYVRADFADRVRRGDADPRLEVSLVAECIAAMWARCAVWWAEDPQRAPRDVVLRTLVRLTQSGVAGTTPDLPTAPEITDAS